jgi:hypothetical protein
MKLKEVNIKVNLRNGDVINGSAKFGVIEFVTDYGKLEIPIADTTYMELGVTPDKKAFPKAETLYLELAESNEDRCRNAYEELVRSEIGVIPLLNAMIASGKYGPAVYPEYTAESALAELMAKHNVKDDYTEHDVITLKGVYQVPGGYDFASLDLRTDFGNLNIPKSRIKAVEIFYEGDGDVANKVFKLNANTHVSGNANGGWLKTGIKLRHGQKFSLTASGEVTLASLSNQKYKPDGTVTYPDGQTYPPSTTDPNTLLYGNVVYKVGETGALVKAGSKYSGSANGNGLLYLSVYETVFNSANSGSYTVNINLG